MACLVCNHGLDGETENDGAGVLQVQITEVGGLDPDLQLPEGGIDVRLCGECWRWIRNLAADPTALLGDGRQQTAAAGIDATDD